MSTNDQLRAALEASLDDISEPAYHGYENPNTFGDGVGAARAAVLSVLATQAAPMPASGAAADERTAFEAAAVSFGWPETAPASYWHSAEEDYSSNMLSSGWAFWKARAALATQGQEAEATAYCNPSDPDAATAFAWPGTDRRAEHTSQLYTHPPRAQEAAPTGQKCPECVNGTTGDADDTGACQLFKCARCNGTGTLAAPGAFVDDDLDFEPSEQFAVADMANIGHALMQALPEGYSYNDSPVEIVSDLQNKIADQEAAPTASHAGVPAVSYEEVLRIAEMAERAHKAPQRDAHNLIEDVCDALAAILKRQTDATPTAAPDGGDADWKLIVAALEHGQPQLAHHPETVARHAAALAAARRLATTPQAAPNAVAADPQCVTVGAMHKCRADARFDQCAHCGATAEELAKPCKKWMADADLSRKEGGSQ